MAVATKNPMLLMSQRETAVQELLGRHHRKIVSQFMKEQYESSVGDNDTCGIFLSGGIDSGSMIFSLIEDCGKTIHDAYTAVIEKPEGEGFIESADYTRAKKICDYYGINHHAVVIRRDPDKTCNKMLEIARNYAPVDDWLKSRSDFEVMTMYFACVDAAAERGNSAIFSGLLDGNIHMHSRKESVPNKKRETAFGHFRMNMTTMNNLSAINAQAHVITQKCAENNITIHLSHSAIAAQYPYAYTPWKLLNRPRDKWISILAYADEYAKTTGNPFPKTMAMQTGDSGAREFFDEMVEKSSVPETFFKSKKPMSTSKVFTNMLAKLNKQKFVTRADEDDTFIYIDSSERAQEGYEQQIEIGKDAELHRYLVEKYDVPPIKWLEHLTSGGEEPIKSAVRIDKVTGRSTLDEIDDSIMNNEIAGIFNPAAREPVFAMDDDGNVDDRVDCFGSPLHRGPAFSQNDCPRAQAGLCGLRSAESDDDKPEFHACPSSQSWGSEVAHTVWNFPAKDEANEQINHEWSAASAEVLHMLRTGIGAFVRDEEKFFS